MKYKFKDFETGKIRYTTGKFLGWSKPSGLLNVRYAIFERGGDDLLIPEYLLMPETKNILVGKGL